MLLGTLGASLGKLLTYKVAFRADEGTIIAGEPAIRPGQGF